MIKHLIALWQPVSMWAYSNHLSHILLSRQDFVVVVDVISVNEQCPRQGHISPSKPDNMLHHHHRVGTIITVSSRRSVRLNHKHILFEGIFFVFIVIAHSKASDTLQLLYALKCYVDKEVLWSRYRWCGYKGSIMKENVWLAS